MPEEPNQSNNLNAVESPTAGSPNQQAEPGISQGGGADPNPAPSPKMVTRFRFGHKGQARPIPKTKPKDTRDPLTVKLEHLRPEMQEAVKFVIKPTLVNAAGMQVPRPWRIELSKANYAVIVKGNMPMRVIPFSWVEDVDTMQTWALFNKDLFTGKPQGMFQFKIHILMIPFDKSPDMCDYTGRTYFARFDEVSERQISPFLMDTPEDASGRMEDKLALSELEQLRLLLKSQTKPKTNWAGIIRIAMILIVLALVGYELLTNPQLLTAITHLGI